MIRPKMLFSTAMGLVHLAFGAVPIASVHGYDKLEATNSAATENAEQQPVDEIDWLSFGRSVLASSLSSGGVPHLQLNLLPPKLSKIAAGGAYLVYANVQNDGPLKALLRPVSVSCSCTAVNGSLDVLAPHASTNFELVLRPSFTPSASVGITVPATIEGGISSVASRLEYTTACECKVLPSNRITLSSFSGPAASVSLEVQVVSAGWSVIERPVSSHSGLRVTKVGDAENDQQVDESVVLKEKLKLSLEIAPEARTSLRENECIIFFLKHRISQEFALLSVVVATEVGFDASPFAPPVCWLRSPSEISMVMPLHRGVSQGPGVRQIYRANVIAFPGNSASCAGDLIPQPGLGFNVPPASSVGLTNLELVFSNAAESAYVLEDARTGQRLVILQAAK